MIGSTAFCSTTIMVVVAFSSSHALLLLSKTKAPPSSVKFTSDCGAAPTAAAADTAEATCAAASESTRETTGSAQSATSDRFEALGKKGTASDASLLFSAATELLPTSSEKVAFVGSKHEIAKESLVQSR